MRLYEWNGQCGLAQCENGPVELLQSNLIRRLRTQLVLRLQLLSAKLERTGLDHDLHVTRLQQMLTLLLQRRKLR